MKKSELRFLHEERRDIPIVSETDVLVVGGGPAGIMAALAAARSGASVSLVERYGFLGGMAANALVGPFAGVRHRYGGGRIIGGIPWEMILAMEKEGGALIEPIVGSSQESEAPDSERSARGDIPFDPEVLKSVSESMCMDAKVRIFFHSYASSVQLKGNNIAGVITESKSGRRAHVGKVVIDATGDADIAKMSGVGFAIGRDGDYTMQPMTLMFRLGGVDTGSLGDLSSPYISPEIRKRAIELVDKGLLPVFGGPWTFWGSTFRPHEVMVNMVRLWGDATNTEVLTRNEITARSHIKMFIRFLRSEFSAFRDAYLMDSGPQIGIRESRRIVGKYSLTADDITSNRDFPDAVALGGHVIDIHSPDGKHSQIRRRVSPYQIPYACLVTNEMENLIVAGRPISATHEAHGSLRVMGTCMAVGQAAGVASGLSTRYGVSIQEVNVDDIQDTLRDWKAPFKRGILDDIAATP